MTHAPQQVFGIIDPDYARIFTQARIVAWQYGYACLAHGTFTRDLDLLLVPWANQTIPEADGVINRIANVCGLMIQSPPADKPHGRKAWSLLLPGLSEVRWVDVSVFGSRTNQPANRRDLCHASDAEVLETLPLYGNFSQDEKEAFCAGVRRCAQHLWPGPVGETISW